MKKILLLQTILIVFLALGVSCKGSSSNSQIIARYITNEHYRYSPVEMNDEVYFPSNFKKNKLNNTEGIGMLGKKDKGFFNDSFFLTGEVLAAKNDSEYTSFEVIDDLSMNYIKSEYLSKENIIKNNIDNYDKFILCNDSGSYSENGKEIRVHIDKDVVRKFVSKFKNISYNIDDFNNVDNIYYIYVDSSSKKIHDRTFDDPIVYIGTIFLKKNKFYYGNLENEINGELLEELLKITR